jgi:hypothetical protein
MNTKKPATSKEKIVADGKNKPAAKIAKPAISQNGEPQPTPKKT